MGRDGYLLLGSDGAATGARQGAVLIHQHGLGTAEPDKDVIMAQATWRVSANADPTGMQPACGGHP